MKNQISKWLSIVLPIALGAFLIVYTYNKFTPEQIEEIKSQFQHANYWYILISLFFGLLALYSRAQRWIYSLEPLGYKPKLATNFMAVCVAYFMNLTIPRSGEVSRALVLKKYEDIPFDKAFGTIIAERIVDFIFLLSFIFLAIVLQYDIFKTFVLDNLSLKQLGMLIFILVAGFCIALWLYKKSKNRWILALKAKLSGLMEGIQSILTMKKKGLFIFHSFFIWLCYVLMFYVTIFALPETSNLSFNAVLMAFITGGIAITLTNSGFGAYPFLISKILLVYAVPETAGNAFGWIVWTSQTLMIVVLGLLSFLILPILKKNK
ncbi:MAG: lysylphosphatidylglycerol synthase transmembrane domain-containing protein [Flavobacterium sp.]|nr:lysylphosphatidylglycerol synthase transmembrane domain-containing protein [Flavobacterium sp.]